MGVGVGAGGSVTGCDVAGGISVGVGVGGGDDVGTLGLQAATPTNMPNITHITVFFILTTSGRIASFLRCYLYRLLWRHSR